MSFALALRKLILRAEIATHIATRILVLSGAQLNCSTYRMPTDNLSSGN